MFPLSVFRIFLLCSFRRTVRMLRRRLPIQRMFSCLSSLLQASSSSLFFGGVFRAHMSRFFRQFCFPDFFPAIFSFRTAISSFSLSSLSICSTNFSFFDSSTIFFPFTVTGPKNCDESAYLFFAQFALNFRNFKNRLAYCHLFHFLTYLPIYFG